MKHADYNTLPKPDRIARLPHYKGIPITATTLVKDGIPYFKSADAEKVWEYKRDGKCSICGEPLNYWKAFMVTEKEAKTREVFEAPNHEECLRYAFNICPWLFYSKATYSDVDKIDIEGAITLSAHPDRTAEPTATRPETLGIYICRSYENVIIQKRFRVCKVAPAKRIEWIEGR